MPREILEAIKWIMVISAIGVWVIVIIKFGFNFFFKDIEKRVKK